MMVEAVYEHGVFRPLTEVDLPEGSVVRFETHHSTATRDVDEHQKRIFEILSRSYDTGESDLAARHGERAVQAPHC